VFRIGEGVDAAKLKEGADIEFVADRVNGKLTVTEVK
jgi:Cu/Ag efflux protein CusF